MISAGPNICGTSSRLRSSSTSLMPERQADRVGQDLDLVARHPARPGARAESRTARRASRARRRQRGPAERRPARAPRPAAAPASRTRAASPGRRRASPRRHFASSSLMSCTKSPASRPKGIIARSLPVAVDQEDRRGVVHRRSCSPDAAPCRRRRRSSCAPPPAPRACRWRRRSWDRRPRGRPSCCAGVVALRIDRDEDHLHVVGRRRRAPCAPAASVASVVGQTAAQWVKPNDSSTTLPR